MQFSGENSSILHREPVAGGLSEKFFELRKKQFAISFNLLLQYLR